MTKKESLHSLIHSLTRNEKRYFKVFCKASGKGQNYLKLFEAIEKQETYDETAIRKKFQGASFLRQLHVTKNYLRTSILKSLRNFHSANSKEIELKELLQNMEILFNKELFRHCEQELKKADQIAKDYELLPGQLEVENWKRKLIQAQTPHNRTAIADTLANRTQIINQMSNLTDYWKLAVEVSGAMGGYPIDTVPNLHWLQNPNHALTLRAKVLHFNARYLAGLSKGENDSAVQALYELIDTLEQHPLRIKEHPHQYAGTINNCLSYLVFQKSYEEAMVLARRAKAFYAEWKVGSENKGLLKQVLRTYNVELEIYRDTRKFESDPETLTTIETFVETYTHKMPPSYRLSFWFQLANIHFLRKDFSRSLHWLNQLLNARNKGVRTDLQVQARMLNLMVHTEQQNLFVLRYFVDSTRRFMKKQREVQPFERILLSFFAKLGRIPVGEYRAAFRELQGQLFPERGEALVPGHLDYIDYGEWIGGRFEFGWG